MQKMIIHESAYQLGIQNPVACVIDGIFVQRGRSERLDRAVAQTIDMVQAGIPLRRPEAAGFAALFARMGYPRQTPAGQRLVASIARKGFPRHDNVVDACNVTSAWYCAGIGIHDASSLCEDIVVTRATGQETIIPLFKATAQRVRAGDLVYASKGRVLAWLGRRDVDSQELRIVEKTRSILCVVLGNERTSRDSNQAICEHFLGLVRLTCPDAAIRFLDTERLLG